MEDLKEALIKIITFIPEGEYEKDLQQAKELLRGHEKDEDFVALALHMGCKVWCYEKRLFDIGVAVSTREVSTALSD